MTSLASMFDPIQPTPEQEPVSVKELTKLASSYLALKEEIEKKEAEVKELKEKQSFIQNSLLDKLHGEMSSFRLESGHLITACTKFRFTLPPKASGEERKKALAWLKRVGARDMVAEDVNAQTMGKFLRERAEQGKDITPLIKKFEERYLSVRKD